MDKRIFITEEEVRRITDEALEKLRSMIKELKDKAFSDVRCLVS